jgi:hypothetical protein
MKKEKRIGDVILKRKRKKYRIHLSDDAKNMFNRILENDVPKAERKNYQRVSRLKGTFGPASECRSLSAEEISKLYGR